MVSHISSTKFHRIAAWLAIMVFLSSVGAFSAQVEANLDRDTVPAGEGALLTLKIEGGNAEEPKMPAVENLIVQPRGRSQQMQMFNGRTSVSMIYQYAVGSHTPGDYQIPAIDVTVDGKNFSTVPLKLKILDSGAAQPPAGMPPNAAPPQAADAEDADVDDGQSIGLLTVELATHDRNHVYVGEIAPVRIRAWIPEGARPSLRSGIKPEGKAFTLHNVSERPQQTHEMKDGKRYLVVTWFGGISATKDGTFPASLSVDATLAVRDRKALKPRRRAGGPFNDPFFDRMFDDMNVPMVQKDVTLKSDDQEIEVRPLPEKDRPEGFTGAVGDFKFDNWQLPTDWKTGEPQQVTVRLSGSGNFALMKAPALTPREAWKSYAGKEEFTPGDVASFAGSKIFQFSAVPRVGGEPEAALEFSFFDPAAGAYKTIASTPKKIRVTGEAIKEDASVPVEKPKEPVKIESSLVGQHRTVSPRGNLVPLVSRPAFKTLLGIGCALACLGGVLAFIRIRRGDPARIARLALEKSVQDALRTAAACAGVNDVPGFFAAGRLAIQHQLGFAWNQSPHAITSAEIHARVPEDSPVARFFAAADRHDYSQQASASLDPKWRSLLDEALKSLTSTAA